MREQVIISRIANGRLSDTARASLVAALKNADGKLLQITVAEKKPRRSSSQNRFYWGQVIPLLVDLFNSFGNNVDEQETHEFVKEHIWRLTKTIIKPDGSRGVLVCSSTGLTKQEWESKLELTREWAAQYGVAIPFPDEHLGLGRNYGDPFERNNRK